MEAVSLVLVEADSLQGFEGCDLAESDLPLPALGKGTEEGGGLHHFSRNLHFFWYLS